MFIRLLSMALAVLLISVTSVPLAAQAQSGSGSQADEIKAKVTRLGTGRRARVEVKLKDNAKLKGYIGEIGEQRFTLIDPKRGTVLPIPYDQVQKIKNTTHEGLFALGLGAGVIGGVMLVVVLAL